MRRSAALAAGALAVAVVVTASACAPGGTSDEAAEETGAVATDPAEIGEVTVTVLDTFVDTASPIGRWMVKVVDAFEAEYPDITIERQSEAATDVNATLRLRLSEDSTPDIVPANQGWSGVGDLAASGLLANLDDYAEAYDWRQRLPETILQQSMVTPEGTEIGQGSQFGLPINQGAFITVFYNRALLDGLGLEPPATFGEFEDSLAAAAAAGITPIQLGTQDGWSSTALLLAVQAALAEGTSVADLVFSDGGADAAGTALTEAAATYDEWRRAGWFPADFVGVPSGDANQKFVDGEGLYYFWYSGFLPFADQAHADEFGQFILPREDGGPLTAVGASSQNFSVAERSDAKDAAALFLDFMASDAAGEFAMEESIIPMFGSFEPGTGSAMLDDGLVELATITENNGYVPYLDWTTPAMLDVLTQNLQLMFDGQVTPDDVTAAVQAEYDQFTAEG